MDKRLMVFLYIIFFICVFLITLVMDLSKIKKRKVKNITELQYMVNKFNLDVGKLNLKKTCFIISFINSLIISSVVMLVSLLDDTALAIQLMIAFILLFALIFFLYEIYGRLLVKKGCVKKENKSKKKKGSRK